MRYLLVFLATAGIDWVWTQCVMRTTEKDAARAAGWSSVLVLLSAYSTVSIVEEHALIFPAMAGAFVGTWIAVKQP